MRAAALKLEILNLVLSPRPIASPQFPQATSPLLSSRLLSLEHDAGEVSVAPYALGCWCARCGPSGHSGMHIFHRYIYGHNRD